jgi:hypothetical protein
LTNVKSSSATNSSGPLTPKVSLKDISNVQLRRTTVPLKELSVKGADSPSLKPSANLRKVRKSPGGTPLRTKSSAPFLSPLHRAIEKKFKVFEFL